MGLLRAVALAAFLPLLASASGCQTVAGTPVYLLRVEKADTLANIAAKYDTSPAAIAKLNGLTPGSPMTVGAVLKVEPGPYGLVPVPAPRAKKSAATETATEPDGPGTDAEAGGGLLFGGRTRGAGLDWPLYGDLSSTYGDRHGRFHHGIDIRARRGSAIVASGAGTVEFAGRQHGYGRVVIVRHGQLKTLYAHLSAIKVKAGERVGRGIELGTAGTSGNATGPHLHFEIRNLQNQSVDPLKILEPNKLLSAR